MWHYSFKTVWTDREWPFMSPHSWPWLSCELHPSSVHARTTVLSTATASASKLPSPASSTCRYKCHSACLQSWLCCSTFQACLLNTMYSQQSSTWMECYQENHCPALSCTHNLKLCRPFCWLPHQIDQKYKSPILIFECYLEWTGSFWKSPLFLSFKVILECFIFCLIRL